MPYKDIEKRRATQKAYIARRRAEDPEGFKAIQLACSRKYVKTHHEKVLENHRASRKKHLEKRRAEDRAYARLHRAERMQYAKDHREQHLAAVQKWQAAHPEEVRAQRKRWWQGNPEKIFAYNKARRARKNGAPHNDFTHEQWVEIQAAQDHRCYYCKKRCKGKLTQDHIIPLSQGGSHTAQNMIGACGSCNSRKGTRKPPIPVQPFLLTVAPAKKKKAS